MCHLGHAENKRLFKPKGLIHHRMMRRSLLCGLFFAVFVGPAAVAAAMEPAFRADLVADAESRENLTEEKSPEGKAIERVVVAPYDVIVPSDPWPGWLNWFHSRTKVPVIERELLFRQGEPWRTDLVEETERNLRANLYLTSA